MQPLSLRVHRILDFGSVVSLVCGDPETDAKVTIHIDYEPQKSNLLSALWRRAGPELPIEYAADQLTLHLHMLPTGDADGVSPVELDSSSPVPMVGERVAVWETEL